MAYWWVNHKQTFKNEFTGGYIWAPKVNKNSSRNQSYINLTLAKPGDIVFSYASTFIKAIGVVEASFEEVPRPKDFGRIGEQWNNDGYLVRVNWMPVYKNFKPKDYIAVIRDLLPEKYSPIQSNGNGNQSMYLAKIDNALGDMLLSLINHEISFISSTVRQTKDEVREEFKEDVEENAIKANKHISETEKEQLIKARRGQGIFKSNLLKIENSCRLTGVNNPIFLVASHIKPWVESNNEEKLDGNNGLLLSPHVDKLFDRGWMGFRDNGDILIKDIARKTFFDWNLKFYNVGYFNKKQKYYLAHHREKFNLK